MSFPVLVSSFLVILLVNQVHCRELRTVVPVSKLKEYVRNRTSQSTSANTDQGRTLRDLHSLADRANYIRHRKKIESVTGQLHFDMSDGDPLENSLTFMIELEKNSNNTETQTGGYQPFVQGQFSSGLGQSNTFGNSQPNNERLHKIVNGKSAFRTEIGIDVSLYINNQKVPSEKPNENRWVFKSTCSPGTPCTSVNLDVYVTKTSDSSVSNENSPVQPPSPSEDFPRATENCTKELALDTQSRGRLCPRIPFGMPHSIIPETTTPPPDLTSLNFNFPANNCNQKNPCYTYNIVYINGTVHTFSGPEKTLEMSTIIDDLQNKQVLPKTETTTPVTNKPLNFNSDINQNNNKQSFKKNADLKDAILRIHFGEDLIGKNGRMKFIVDPQLPLDETMMYKMKDKRPDFEIYLLEH